MDKGGGGNAEPQNVDKINVFCLFNSSLSEVMKYLINYTV